MKKKSKAKKYTTVCLGKQPKILLLEIYPKEMKRNRVFQKIASY